MGKPLSHSSMSAGLSRAMEKLLLEAYCIVKDELKTLRRVQNLDLSPMNSGLTPAVQDSSF